MKNLIVAASAVVLLTEPASADWSLTQDANEFKESEIKSCTTGPNNDSGRICIYKGKFGEYKMNFRIYRSWVDDTKPTSVTLKVDRINYEDIKLSDGYFPNAEKWVKIFTEGSRLVGLAHYKSGNTFEFETDILGCPIFDIDGCVEF